MNQKKIDKAITDCYTKLYAEATPPADFQKLMDEAELNERGQKVIPYWGHEINPDRELEIINLIADKYKFPDYLRQALRTTILLGVSPKTKQDENA